MKLGDNMAPVEACKVWNDVCPRKTRPPKIGDIPRHVAVDEESPGSSTSRSSVQVRDGPTATPKKSMREITTNPSNVHEITVETGETLSVLETIAKPSANPNKKFERCAPITDPANSQLTKFHENSTILKPPIVRSKNFHGSQEISNNDVKSEISKINDQTNFHENNGCPAKTLKSSNENIAKFHKDIEKTLKTLNPRKDSALEIDDDETRSTELRDRLSTIESDNRDGVPRPRRESSGYFSNLGTFDDERWVCCCTTDQTVNNHDTSTSTRDCNRERRRSSSVKPKIISMGCGQQNNRKTSSNDDTEIHEMLETDLSSVGITVRVEMPNIDEQSSLEMDNSLVDNDRIVEDSVANEFNDLTITNADSANDVYDDNDQVVVANLGTNGETPNDDADAKFFLPKTIKVYQLLSTQSEDRGDGDARFYDRRISLQIPRHDDNNETRDNPMDNVLPIDCASLVADYNDEKKLIHADSVPIIKIPSTETTTGVDNELRLTPGIRLSGSDNTSGSGLAGIRPIYPYCPYSPYASPQGSPRTNRRRPLRESRRVSIDSRQGALQLNQYKLLNNIGQGSYGIVKLAYNEEDDTHYAMKILSKKKLMKKAGIFGRIAPRRKGATDPLAKVYREIALLKKLDHPNVVKLVEVLDDPDEDNLYLVFELVQKGEVMQLPTDKPLDEQTARRHFRDVVMGVEYLHYQRIVHRDIKPSNLLVDGEGRVKVADLGVSAELRAAGELLSGSAGTPAFAAPETTSPGAQYSGEPCDVWSMGVTLYSLVTGKVPWDGAGSVIAVQSAVRSEPLKFPENSVFTDDFRDLVSQMLSKDPTKRITLSEIKKHSWVTNRGEEPLPDEAENCRLPVTVTDEEVARVVTRVPKLDTLILIKTMLKQHSFQNPFLPRRIVRSGCPMGEASGFSGSRLDQQPSITDNHDSSTESIANSEIPKNNKSQHFYKSGRSNSAPDSYEWQTNGRQISGDPTLPPVTEFSGQEQPDVEKR